jgi:hypothetical protein
VKRERRCGLQVPRGVIETSANIVGKTGSVPYVSSPAAREITFLLYAKERAIYKRLTSVPHYLATWGGMVYSSVDMTPVLANLAFVTASWRALYLNRGGFEGGGVVVDWGVSMWARGSRRR